MKALICILAVLICSDVFCQEDYTKFVDPIIGTSGHGHTYPGASLPFGMVQLSPDTDTHGWDWCSGYHYSDNSIIGFSHTHLSGTGCADYGDILLMPTLGKLELEPGTKSSPEQGYRSRFQHINEKTLPGYYSVLLDDYNIKVELTATTRAGFHKYTFPAAKEAYIILDLKHGIEDKATETKIEITNDHTIIGYRRSTGWADDQVVYFIAEFSRPFLSSGISEGGKILADKMKQGKELKAFVKYTTKRNDAILVKVGISSVSVENAKKNLDSEIPYWNFAITKNQAAAEWNKALSKIQVFTNDNKIKTTFYTALYHSMLAPNIFSDVDSTYRGMDKKIYKGKDFNMYTVFSLWDTFRAEHPLFTIIEKKRTLDFINSLLAKYDESGLLPVLELASNETGTMIGYHSIPVIVDAYFKGVRSFDVQKAYNAMKKSAEADNHGLKDYKQFGYIGTDHEHESVSKTLEYAYDDWCIAKMAKELGEEKDYKYYTSRALSYSNLLDPQSKLMRPKRNGKFIEPFDPYTVSGDFTEANSWQYSFFVPQDVNGLINQMGGDKIFTQKLDDLFATSSKLTGRTLSDITGLIGQYAHGNEPSHHMAYLYNYSGEPWKTAEKVRDIMSLLYSDQPEGLSGNEDCGQMSAWYVFSSIGFYPVTPGDDKYILGSPLFDSVKINMEDGKIFSVKVRNNSGKNIYIQSAKLNGIDYPYSYLKHADISNGGDLEIVMGASPDYEWGTKPEFRPISEINIDSFMPVPYLVYKNNIFKDSVKISIKSTMPDADIFYSINGEKEMKYDGPFLLDNSTVIKTCCSKGNLKSSEVISSFYKTPSHITIKLNTQYSSQYSAGGELGLIDGVKGTIEYRTGFWQGYQGNDFDVVIDLESVKEIRGISTSFLQRINALTLLPEEIEYSISEDGKKYSKIYTQRNDSKETSINKIEEFRKDLNNVKARYVKIHAKNISKLPVWHFAAGEKAWIFIDEITIE